MDIQKIKEKLIQITSILDKKLSDDSIEIIDRKVPHKASSLPDGKMGVYSFWYGDQCLKIGKVGLNSNARYLSQHYCPNSSRSNLAKSLLQDSDFRDTILNEVPIKKWMLENLRRVDIIVDGSCDIFTLGLIESCLHYCYNPKYEGFKTQREI